MNTTKNKAVLQMLVCSTLWSSGGILIKLVPWNSMVLSGARSLVAIVTIGVYMLWTRQAIMIDKRTILGGLALCLTYTCFVAANKMTTAANAIVLQFTSPIFIMVFSVLFLHERFHRRDVAAVVLTLAGISLCFFDRLGSGGMPGNCMGVLSGVCLSVMYLIVGGGQVGERMSAIFLGQLMTALIGIPFAFLHPPELTGTTVLCVVALGVVQIGIPYILYALAAEACPPLACSLLGAVEPLLNPVWVFLFDGEAPGPLALLGGVVVIATVTLWCIAGEKRTEATQHGKT